MSVAEHRHSEGRGEVLLAAAAVEAYRPQWFAAPAATGQGGLQGGRGNVRVIDTDIGPLVHRGYRRGGLPRHFIRDRYLWLGADRTRSFQEFRLMRRLHALGLPVPMPVAARYQRSGLAYTADLLTCLIPDATPLAVLLADDGSGQDNTLESVARSIAAMHARQVWHADLNAHNILVDREGRAWLIDFDRAREHVESPVQLAGNLHRLLRSLRKLLPPQRLADVEAVWPRFIDSYRRALATT
ncbi:3-deoxy-D-manno-octulosonic acid kinase [Pseudofulvimonas gallinarii]|nr:3-deoxy-D-manno-octulosonic acid kinase [Pseudofulvimonas gallinarii]